MYSGPSSYVLFSAESKSCNLVCHFDHPMSMGNVCSHYILSQQAKGNVQSLGAMQCQQLWQYNIQVSSYTEYFI